MSCDWEGNHRSSIALAMHHRLDWFNHLRAQGLSKGDEHPTNTPSVKERNILGMELQKLIHYLVSKEN